MSINLIDDPVYEEIQIILNNQRAVNLKDIK